MHRSLKVKHLPRRWFSIVIIKNWIETLLEQQMANLPTYVTCPSPPWLYLTLDYAGPFSCYDEVKRRVSRKVWLVIFVCLTTKAVEVLPCPDYDTDSFIKVVQRFFLSHGRTQLVRSDLGSPPPRPTP